MFIVVTLLLPDGLASVPKRLGRYVPSWRPGTGPGTRPGKRARKEAAA
jgi:hypothetical protein